MNEKDKQNIKTLSKRITFFFTVTQVAPYMVQQYVRKAAKEQKRLAVKAWEDSFDEWN